MNKTELKKYIEKELNILSEEKIEKDTLKWYLHNHLENILMHLKQTSNSKELLKLGKNFMLFCADSMDWDTAEYKTFAQLGEQIVRVAKEEASHNVSIKK